MAKLDRLGWAGGLSLRAYGVRVGIRTNAAEIPQPILDRLPPGWRPDPGSEVDHLYSLVVGGAGKSGVQRFNLLYSGPFRLARTMDLQEVFSVLESDLQVYLAEKARTRLFVHAGVIVWKGRAILLPGSSGSGKTTLVGSLVRAGGIYYSDEYAVLDPRGRVHAYPRPLAVGNEANGAPQDMFTADRPGFSLQKAAPVGLIAVAKYKAGRHWRPRRVSKGQSVLELLSHTVPARRRPKSALATLRNAVSGATVLKGFRGEAEETAELLLRRWEK